ncbi:MAG TPA: murein biosynthesis integral membrane protein MurJ [Candidatus Binatia bacterium]|nr:murein biosynthesis integral membrane protein MurJ [Candidatus Binatia bacterium]
MQRPAARPDVAGRPVPEATGRFAALVATGIFASRLAGFVRQHFLARYLGLSEAADAFNAAFRIPNVLQNLFGEGVLSASFIPVYAGLRARGDDEDATRLAGAIGSLLALVTSGLVALGVLATPLLIDAIAPGFAGEERALTITLVRILFPGAGLLVLSAWCLGILNSHRRFLLSYAAPIVWNLAIIVALLGFGGRTGEADLAVVAAWASLVGSALQLLVQLPAVVGLLRRFVPALGLGSRHVREVVRNFVPVFVGRGVVQISAYVDTMIASFLPVGAVAALTNAQTLYVLPVSLFGMAVSAAELPVMSSAVGAAEEVAAELRARLDAGLRRIAFLVVPSAMAFLALGDVLAAALFQAGKFTRDDSVWVWGILAGSAVGLLAQTLGRLYASAYYALRDTRTPLRFAIVRVALTTALGVCFALPLPPRLGLDPKWGAAGLTVSAGIAGWVEFALLRRALGRRIGATGVPAPFVARLWAAAGAAAAVAWAVKLAVGPLPPLALGAVTVAPYGAAYFLVAAALGVREGRALLARVPVVGRLPG